MHLSSYIRVFQAQWACPALSNSHWFRGGIFLLLPDTQPSLSQHALSDPALQRKPTAMPRLWATPHWRCAAAQPASKRRVCHMCLIPRQLGIIIQCHIAISCGSWYGFCKCMPFYWGKKNFFQIPHPYFSECAWLVFGATEDFKQHLVFINKSFTAGERLFQYWRLIHLER